MRTSALVAAMLMSTASAKMDKAEMEQISLGMFEGALDEEHLEDIVKCSVIDFPHSIVEIETAIKDIEQKSVSGVIAGLEEMAKSFDDMSAGLKTCANAKNADQIKKILAMVETFKNPETLAIHIGHDILFNGVNIEKRINMAVTDFQSKSYVEFGKQMGSMLSEIAIGTQLKAQMLKDGETDEKRVMLEQMSLGMFEGMLDEEHLEDVVTCATVDAPHMVVEIEAAVKDMSQKSVTGVISGLDEMAKAMSDMSSGLKTCANTKNADQAKRILAMIETFKNPETLALHVGHDILFNGVNIEKRINMAVTDFQSKSYVEFGKQMGSMLSEIAIGTQLKAQMLKDGEVDEKRVMIEQMSLGLFEGALNEEHLEDVVTCVTVDAPEMVTQIEGAVKDMEKKSISGVISGLDEMANAFTAMSSGLKTCGNAKNANQVMALLAMMETFKNPETLALHVGHDILFNGVNIEKRINMAVTDFQSKSYVEFGKQMGSMLSEITIGTQVGQQLKQEPYLNEAAQIATGLLRGAVKAELKGDLTKCLHDGTTIYTDAKAVVTDIEEKSLKGVIAAAQEIYQTVAAVKLATSDCSGIIADWEKLETIAAIVSNPMTLTYEVEKHMIFNGVDIHDKMWDAVAQYKNGKFEAFGEDLGGALAELIVGGAIQVQEKSENHFLF